jgi:hypothetical protein
MARLIIDGVCDVEAVDVGGAHLLHLVELQQQGRHLVEGGLGMSGLEQMKREGLAFRREWLAWDARRKASEEAGDPFVDDEPLPPDSAALAAGITVFLSRRQAGHRVSLVEALQVPQVAIRIVEEPADAAGAVDPQGPGDAPGSETEPADASTTSAG